MAYAVPLVMKLLKVMDVYRNEFFVKARDAIEAFAFDINELHRNVLGHSCHAVVVCMSHGLAIQTYNELVALTKGLGIRVLLCRATVDNSLYGNLLDISAGRGHIVVTTLGRAKTLIFEEMSRYPAGPILRAKLKDDATAMEARNALLHSNVFCDVKHLVIDDANFNFDIRKKGKAEDIRGLRQLTISLRWTGRFR